MTTRDDWDDGWGGGWTDTTEAAHRAPAGGYPYPDPPAGPAGGGDPAPRRGIGTGLVGALIGALLVAVLGFGGYILVTRDDDAAPAEQATVSALVGQNDSGWAPVQQTAPDSGTYTGVLSQRGTRRSDQDFSVSMTFSANGSTVDYPTLACSGTLSPTGDSGGARVYTESITSGRCDPRGTWYVTRGADGATLSVEYRSDRSDYVVVGQLTR